MDNNLNHEDSENNSECQIKEKEEPNIWEFHNMLVKNQQQSIQKKKSTKCTR